MSWGRGATEYSHIDVSIEFSKEEAAMAKSYHLKWGSSLNEWEKEKMNMTRENVWDEDAELCSII